MDTSREPSDDDRGGASIPLEELVASSHERYEEIIDTASVGIAHVTLEGLVVRANPFLSEMTGFTQDELRSMRVDDLITAESGEGRRELAHFFRGAVEEVACAALCSRKDGRKLSVSIQGALVRAIDETPTYGVMIVDHHGTTEA